ncbi:hypothetical protein ACJIZ3_020071 [Penstemon smallii]|uniref:Uncharacterized protein n=1 Tax=Penstemon smallii TaxID=265156 RepID=A0ABD3SHK0_9LAMI
MKRAWDFLHQTVPILKKITLIIILSFMKWAWDFQSSITENDYVLQKVDSHTVRRVCLDRWVGYGHWTCPLCRNYMKTTPRICAQEDVLIFNFCDVKSSNNNSTWWLR